MTIKEVKEPNHYILQIKEEVKVEVLEIIEAVLTLEEYRGYLHGNVIKYILRAKKKHETPEVDFLKGREYINYYLETYKYNDFNKLKEEIKRK